MALSSLAVMTPEGGLSRYLTEIRKFPMLTKDEEFMLAKRWQEHEDPTAAHKLVTSHLQARGQDRHGLPRLRPAHRGGHLRRQRRPDAGGEEVRSRPRLPPGDLRHVVDPRVDPGIHPALLVAGEDGHHRRPEKAVLQPAQSQEPDLRARGRRHASRAGRAHRHPARRDQRRRDLDEPPPLRAGRVAERAVAFGQRERMAGLAGRRRPGLARRPRSPRVRNTLCAWACSKRRCRN